MGRAGIAIKNVGGSVAPDKALGTDCRVTSSREDEEVAKEVTLPRPELGKGGSLNAREGKFG